MNSGENAESLNHKEYKKRRERDRDGIAAAWKVQAKCSSHYSTQFLMPTCDETFLPPPHHAL